MCSLAGALAVFEDKDLSDGASAAPRARERLVVDHHVGGERVKRRGVRVDQHRGGGSYGLQVRGRLADDVELVEEAREEALGDTRACIGRRLIGEANLANKIGEAAGHTGDLSPVRRVSIDAIRRAGLAMLAGEE